MQVLHCIPRVPWVLLGCAIMQMHTAEAALNSVWQGDRLSLAWMRDKVSAQKGALSGMGSAVLSSCSCVVFMKWRSDSVKPFRVLNCRPTCTGMLATITTQEWWLHCSICGGCLPGANWFYIMPAQPCVANSMLLLPWPARPAGWTWLRCRLFVADPFSPSRISPPHRGKLCCWPIDQHHRRCCWILHTLHGHLTAQTTGAQRCYSPMRLHSAHITSCGMH